MSTARMLIGDVFDVIATIPDKSVDLVLCSPPFLALRSYLPADHPQKSKEIGQEGSPAEYIQTMLRLAAEYRRVLTDHGSIAVEIGDTYSGSGGAGGDYDEDGMRDGQPRYDGSQRKTRTHNLYATSDRGNYAAGGANTTGEPMPGIPVTGGLGWPMAKSLCGIPTLHAWSLAYGRNLLTGVESPAGFWRVRNLVVWARTNPPVGYLGDKLRPSTSYITWACLSDDRWFDLDAVRTPHQGPDVRHLYPDNKLNGRAGDQDGYRNSAMNPSGAPPLDHLWFDDDEIRQDTWTVPPGGYSGAHFAVWPPELLTIPLEASCPRRVCRQCGGPSRRVVRVDGLRGADFKGEDNDRDIGLHHTLPAPEQIDRTTIGWTSCDCTEDGIWDLGWRDVLGEIQTWKANARRKGTARAEKLRIFAEEIPPLYDKLQAMYHGRLDGFHPGEAWRPGHVLDPFGGSGTTGMVATGRDRDCTLIDLDDRNVELAVSRIGMFLEDVRYVHGADPVDVHTELV